ncbi:exonuclease domain-containing protein [uncultured Piscinibacter sp.]|uniref:3'-5' exonuclease n=1 Tax=uncultured Piscinibacter sp. TaxID=1131835 RepID=UPI00260F0256|nr:exonuclease domain-containing protein [uncultured Piscinibacter sp.]
MSRDRPLLLAMAAAAGVAAALLAAFALGGGLLVWSTLDVAQRDALQTMLGDRIALLAMVALALVAGAAAAAQPLFRRWIAAPAKLREEALVLLSTDVRRDIGAPAGSADLQGLAQALNELARQRDQLRRDIADEVARASRGIEQERNRLAALMSELTQSVVVCNLDGRILLYNNRARMQFRALSDAPTLADGAELIGLGRSIYTVFERKLVAHALESVTQRIQRGAAHPSAQFVTVTRSGQLLRAQMAPVRAAEGDASAGAITGFVLMLDNITRDYEQESERERLLHGLTEGSRGALANLQAAAEMLDDEALEPAMRERFLGVVREEARTMSRRINELAARSAQGLATRWPLEEMLGADFVQAARRRIEHQTGLAAGTGEVDAALWLKLDSFSLLQALGYLAQRLRDEFEVKALHLRLAAGDAQRARLDLVWSGQAMSTETVMSWEMDPIVTGSESSSLTVRDVVQRHGGEFWFERDRVRHQAFFRFLLPLAPSAAAQEASEAAFLRSESRPEYYDFDLFAGSESSHALDDRRLVELAYTVFDTETTGLQPSAGDEIIQIGAARVVNGKLLRGECFEQLVDPRRSIPEASIPIHGITQDMVDGQPTIDEVLPAFHAYAQDTVLVAHNAAFDMRFLQLKEERTGVRFDQPVLDTLLLSAVVHPNQDSHRLEAIAERFDITVIGRHTALGDAMVTAEVFQKLIPLLAERGIHTLGQAREAAQKSYFARVRY